MDGQVVRRDPKVAGLLDRFVCVRVVQGYGIDLARFQFDGELTWAVFFLNADGTVYGRYGSRFSRDADESVSLDGFQEAAEAALTLHDDYPRNKAALAGKRGPAPRWKTPEAIPGLPGKAVKADGSRGGCIHCHAIPGGELVARRQLGEAIPDQLLWPYPNPEKLGLGFDLNRGAVVREVKPGTAAEKAGFRPGDEVRSLGGQPIISVADVQWVLHHAADSEAIPAEVRRGDKSVSLSLTPARGWRRAEDFTWRETTWDIRFRYAGFKSSPVPAGARKKLDLPADAPALRVDEIAPNWVQRRNAAAAKVGLQKGDVIVALDGNPVPRTEAEFLAHLIQRTKPGDTVRLTLLRGPERKTVELPVP